MESKRLTNSNAPGYVPAKLEARVKTGSEASNLAPSILFLAVNEGTEELTIIGTFGDPLTPDRQVNLVRYAEGDLVLDIKDWKKDQIVTRLPPDVLSGDVIVVSRGRKSNPRRLMGWRGQMIYTFDDVGSLLETVVIDLIIRRDASLLRGKDEVGKEPRVSFLHYSIARKDARANSSGKGSWSYESGPPDNRCTTTVTWDGARSVLPSSYYYGGPTPLVGLFDTNVVDVNARTPLMVMALEVVIPEAYTVTSTTKCTKGDPSTTTWSNSINHLPQELFVTDPVSGPHSLRLDLDAVTLDILPGERVAMVDSREYGAPKATATLRWGSIKATLPYDPTLPVRKP
jgi:hypothetical protein